MVRAREGPGVVLKWGAGVADTALPTRPSPRWRRDPFVVFEDKGSPGRAPGAAVIADAFSDALLARMMTAAGLDRPGAPPPGAFVALTAGECEAALEAVR